MHPRRFSRFFSLGFTLCVGLSGAPWVYANPVLATAQSLSNGAQLYQLYCSECHGRETAQRDAVLDDTANAPNDSALIDIALGDKAPAVDKPAEEEEWPEWAQPRDPDLKDEPDVEAELAGVVTAAITDAYAAETESEQQNTPGGLAGKNAAGSFSPPSGATDLSAPQTFFYGTSEEELFKSIEHGTGAAMPGWRTELGSDEAIWDLVNYIRSFWGEEWLY
jgi:mono/diheme cytochrome c family protein